MKRNMKMQENCQCLHCGRGWYFLKGIIALVLGIALWYERLSLPQVVALLLVLAGIKHVLYPKSMCRK